MVNMTQRFILPDLLVSQHLRNTLVVAGTHDQQIHFLAHKNMDLGQLHLTTTLQETDLINEGRNGLLYGVVIGLLIGGYVLFFPTWITVSPTWYSDAAWYVVLIVTAGTASLLMGLGAATLGAHVLNADLREYKCSIDQGKILVMISSRFIQGTRVRQMVNAALQKIPRAITGS